MVLASLLFFLPALALSSKDSVAIVPAEDLKVCEYFDARIVRLREIVNKELLPDVDIGSDLYTTLEESKLCDTVGYVAIPECVANNGGDECVARKTSELIRKSLRAAMKAEKIKEVPSGEKFFATCKHIGYKNVLKTFKNARSLMSAECGLPGLGGGRSRRSLDLLPALLLGGSYDPSSIWFQYFLCKDIDLYCYFFTQGWTQGQYGQYYLYDNLLDDSTGLFAGATDSNLATIALLGGLGGGIGQPSGYYPSYGAHAAPAAQGRKRRETTRCSDEDDSLPNCTRSRKRRQELDEEKEERKRRETRCSDADDSLPNCTSRKRRQEPEKEEEEERKRRETRCSDVDDSLPNCTRRKRRQEPEKEEEEDERKRRETKCSDVDDSLPNCTRRKRRQESEKEEEEERKRRETRCSDEDDSLPNCTKRKRRATVTCDDDDDSLPDCTRKRRSTPSEACEACKKNPDSTECEKC